MKQLLPSMVISGWFRAVARVAIALAAYNASAQTWTGAGSNNAWSTGSNWIGSTAPTPSATTDIAFGGTTRLANNNDLTALGEFRNVTFNANAGAFVIGGNSIRLRGKIRNNSTSTQTVNSTIATASGPGGFIELDPAAGDLAIGGTEVQLGSNQLRVVGAAGKTLTFGTGTIISGSTGSFLLSANSTVVFRSPHTYGGGTVINAGVLTIGDGTINGTPNGSYQINQPGTLRLNRNNTAGTSTWIGGVWSLLSGNGTLAFNTARNADDWSEASLPSGFTGTLLIERGRVATSDAAGSGLGGTTSIIVRSSGQLMDWRGRPITQNLTLAGTGYGEVGYECALRLGNCQVSGPVALSASATIGTTGVATLSNVISGDAGSTLSFGSSGCNGTLILSGNNTYAGNTTISHGWLQIGDSGTTGTLGAGPVTNNGTLAFNRYGEVTVGQAISGSGALRQNGLGSVVLTAANTYGGPTIITSGKLTLGRNAALPGASAVTLGSGFLDAGSYTNSTGTLAVTGAASIVFGSGGKLAFANSSSLGWLGSLRLSGDFVSGVSLRFDSIASGLTTAQLARISATGYGNFALNAQGYLTAAPVADFSAWQGANGTSQTASQDHDGDGVKNGVEYFLRGIANSNGFDALPGVSESAGRLGVTWQKATTYTGSYGTDFVVQTSSTLEPDSWMAETPGADLILDGNSVRYSFPAGARNFARLAIVGEEPPPPLVVDTANAIPLRGHIYRKNQFALALLGSAIKGTTPFEANFDTGSWQTCLPYGALNKANLTVLETNIRDGWGTLADMVRGQLVLKSRDGLTTYTLDNFVFFAMKNENGTDMADDRTQQWSPSILGAFPTNNSIVAALIAKYSTNGLGGGIITESPGGDFVTNWSSAKSYLTMGNDPDMASRLNWYYWSPWFNGQTEFDPIVLPGFKVTLQFPPVAGQTFPDLVMDDQIATLDTGAPDLTMRIAPGDPQRQAPYSQFFNSTRVPHWYSTADCQALNYGVTVKVSFTGSTGQTSSYSFPTANTNGAYIPNDAFIGNWTSNVPWSLTPSTPRNRINLGNNVFFFCKVYFWDFTNQRVGFYFN